MVYSRFNLYQRWLKGRRAKDITIRQMKLVAAWETFKAIPRLIQMQYYKFLNELMEGKRRELEHERLLADYERDMKDLIDGY